MLQTVDYLGAFLTHDRAVEWLESPGVQITWDHDTALGDTLKEKCESLTVRIAEITNVLIRNGAKGYFWMLMNSAPASMFEHLMHCSEDAGMIEMGTDRIYRLGSVHRRWHIYVDPRMPSDVIVIGAGDESRPRDQYGVIKLANFVV